ncbi:helix-turn-helix domain-containing protein [Kitasatospora purpeofusca]|uniref:helix-turn-helix domain-containing protein n=1 Tax=Kitasatospora purpeofusca TaxID=67352 RepID=UPI0035D64260
MLVWEFSAQDLARTRFACSPLAEVATSVEVLKEPGRHAVHLPWVRQAGQRLAGVDWSLLSQLVRLPTVYVPDFLTPVPVDTSPTIEQAVAALAATDPAAVRRDLSRITGELPPLVAELYGDPEAGLARLAGEVLAYWAAAIAPHWPRIQRLTEGEILRRARQMSTGGPAALFADLHPQVSWERDTLRIGHRVDVERRLDGERGLVLAPTVFAWPGVYSQQNPPWQPGLLYPPRGVATLWENSGAAVPDGLARVIGRTRARLLAELDSPASTAELAARLDLSAANVSHHLTALREAGLTARHRTGRTVLYARTEAAELLLKVRH